MTSSLISLEATTGGAFFGPNPFGNASAEASATETPVPRGAPTVSQSPRILWLSVLAQASALILFADTSATVAGSWARDLGHLEQNTNPSSVGGTAVSPSALRLHSVLLQVQSATTRTQAYAAFDTVLADDDLSGAEFALITFLSDPESMHREALLACFADREIKLESASLVAAVAQLLTATDARTRRMAALALASSGNAGVVELGRGLDALSLEWAEDIRSTLRLSA